MNKYEIPVSANSFAILHLFYLKLDHSTDLEKIKTKLAFKSIRRFRKVFLTDPAVF